MARKWNTSKINSIKSNSNMKTYKATIKERGRDGVLTPTYTTSEDVSRKFLIDFWGLNEPDVEWWRIEETCIK